MSQLEAWKLYYKCEPWGYELQMMMTARMQAQLINCTPRGPDAQAVSPTDFMPEPYEP